MSKIEEYKKQSKIHEELREYIKNGDYQVNADVWSPGKIQFSISTTGLLDSLCYFSDILATTINNNSMTILQLAMIESEKKLRDLRKEALEETHLFICQLEVEEFKS